MNDPWLLNIVTSAAGDVLAAIITGSATLLIGRRIRTRRIAINQREQDVR